MVFAPDNALLKSVDLAVQRILKPLHNRNIALSQLFIMFEGRIKIRLQNNWTITQA